VVVTYSPTKQIAKAPPSQEEALLALLFQAETKAYALAHSYDIGGYRDRACRLMSVGEGIRDAALQMAGMGQPPGSPNKTAAWGLKSRALSLRTRLSGRVWVNSGVAPFVPGQTDMGPSPKKRRRRVHSDRYGPST
jgi:hypothetical protein